MPRKTYYIIIAIGVLLLLTIFSLPFFLKNENGESMTVGEAAREFWPFGKPSSQTGFQSDSSATTTPGSTGEEIIAPIEANVPKLRQITTTPTSGSVIFSRNRDIIENKIKKTIKEYIIRYMDRGTGHISETKINTLADQKVTNTTLPQIYETTFSNLGETIVGRYLASNLDDIITFSGIFADKNASSTVSNETTVVKDIKGKTLDSNIREIAFSPSKTKMIYLLNDAVTDGSKILLTNFDGTGKTQIFSSPLREWLLHFPTETRAVIATKPSGITEGYSYILDTATGNLTKLVGNVIGLTVLPSRDLSYVLTGKGGSDISFTITKTSDNSTSGIYNTLPEKCIWSKQNSDVVFCAIPSSIPNALYPDNWYQGLLTFNDQIWKINIKNRSSEVIASPELQANTSIDAINLDISPDDNYLTFINKKDLTLWGLLLDVPTLSASSTASTN